MKKIFVTIMVAVLILTINTNFAKAEKIGVHDTRTMIIGIPDWEWDSPATIGISGTLHCNDFGVCAWLGDKTIDVTGWGRYTLGMPATGTIIVENEETGCPIAQMDPIHLRR